MLIAEEPARERPLADRLFDVYTQVVDATTAAAAAYPSDGPGFSLSRDNLLAYVALRANDLYDVQMDLAWQGLSSLGRLEGSVLWAMERVLAWLEMPVRAPELSRPTPDDAGELLAQRSRALLGRPRPGRTTRMMVTVDSESLATPAFFERLIAEGIDAIRINTAHDRPRDWARIVARLREAEMAAAKESGPARRCHVLVDLAGPKVRTGAIEPDPTQMRVKMNNRKKGPPLLRGCLVEKLPWSTPVHGHNGCGFALAVQETGVLKRLRTDDLLEFTDARGRTRGLRVVRTNRSRVEVEAWKNFRLETPVPIRGPRDISFTVAGPEPAPGAIELVTGARLRLVRDPSHVGRSAGDDAPASIACTAPDVLANVQPGHRVAFDDGKIWCQVAAATPEYLELVVTAPDEPAKLRAEKGINLPDSAVDLPAMTDADASNLRHIVPIADAVGLSFVHRPDDVTALRKKLNKLGAANVGIIAKIETREAVQRLARIILAGLASQPFGVMIARGDLAVETGFENLALLQEEILCLCEAAHTPAIWATQVLESLAKGGLPARAEITDAAMGQRAECVMLNKGPHIIEAVRTLESLLESEERYRLKKRQLFRELPRQEGLFP